MFWWGFQWHSPNAPGELQHGFQLGMQKTAVNLLLYSRCLGKLVRDADDKKRESPLNVVTDGNRKSTRTTSNAERASDSFFKSLPSNQGEAQEKSLEDLIEKGVFGKQLGDQINYISRVLGREGQHQSDRDLPCLNFACGITKQSKITANEQQGVMFLFLLILCSSFSRQNGSLCSLLGEDEIGDSFRYSTHS